MAAEDVEDLSVISLTMTNFVRARRLESQTNASIKGMCVLVVQLTSQ